jgi:hypothetical protein
MRHGRCCRADHDDNVARFRLPYGPSRSRGAGSRSIHTLPGGGRDRPFFATRLSLANPDEVNSASVVLTFDSGKGTTRTMPLTLSPGGTAFVDVGSVSGFESSDVSTTIDSNRPIAVDRMMEWGVDPATGHGYGSALETAAPAPSTTWFLAEGSTVLDFDLYYLLQNPGRRSPPSTSATCSRRGR